MTKLKMLMLVVAATACLMALVGVGSASATVLCKTATSPCGATYGVGTKFNATLKSGTTTTFETGLGSIECSESEMAGEISEAGSKSLTVKIPLGTYKFSLCNGLITIIVKPKLILHWKPIFRFSVTLELGIKITLHLGGVACTYGGESNVGESVGEPTTEIKVNGTLQKVEGGFLCPTTATWKGEYTVNAPTPLYAAES